MYLSAYFKSRLPFLRLICCSVAMSQQMLPRVLHSSPCLASPLLSSPPSPFLTVHSLHFHHHGDRPVAPERWSILSSVANASSDTQFVLLLSLSLCVCFCSITLPCCRQLQFFFFFYSTPRLCVSPSAESLNVHCSPLPSLSVSSEGSVFVHDPWRPLCKAGAQVA